MRICSELKMLTPLMLLIGCADTNDVNQPTKPAPEIKTEASVDAPAKSKQSGGVVKDAVDSPDVEFSDPHYVARPITDADLEGKTLRELSLMRNTIFARVGNRFVKPWLDTHFRSRPWYVPQDKVDYDSLASFDRENAAKIATKEGSFKRAGLEEIHRALEKKKANYQMRAADERELHLVSAKLGRWLGDEKIPVSRRNPLEDPSTLEQQLVLSQVDKLSPRDLRILRNTIFARRGREFKSELLMHHFWAMEWYRQNPKYSDSMLTDVDRRNIALIQSMEKKLGGALSDDQHAHEIGWFGGA